MSNPNNLAPTKDNMRLRIAELERKLAASQERVRKAFAVGKRDWEGENAKMRAALEEANTQLWHAIEAGAYRGVPLQFAMERARSMALDALKP